MRTYPHQPAHGQYRDPKDLTARIRLHQRFSTNPHGWMRWVYDQISLPASGRVLEVGCGNGEIWAANATQLPGDVMFVLTDCSLGMVSAAKRSLPPEIRYGACDAMTLPFSDTEFEAVIANHMLYHVPAPGKAIRDIRRVLRPGGTLYATTNGSDHLKEIPSLLAEYDSQIDCPLNETATQFCLTNGAGLLQEHFSDVILMRYPDSLRITEAEALTGYILSLHGVGNVAERLSGDAQRELCNFLGDRISRDGAITVTKESGMFIAGHKK